MMFQLIYAIDRGCCGLSACLYHVQNSRLICEREEILVLVLLRCMLDMFLVPVINMIRDGDALGALLEAVSLETKGRDEKRRYCVTCDER